MIYWLLYLFCGIVIAACYIAFGKTLAKDPDSGFSATIAYKSKLLDAHPELNSKAQKMYGSLLYKGGFGLMVVVIVGLLCVLNQPQDTIMVGGNLVLVIELLYILGLYLWMNQYLQKLTGSKPAKPAKQPKDNQSASPKTTPAAQPEPASMKNEAAASTSLNESVQNADTHPTITEPDIQSSAAPQQEETPEQSSDLLQDPEEIADHNLQSLILDTPNPPASTSANPETAAQAPAQSDENEEVDHSLQSLIQADVHTSQLEQPAQTEEEPVLDQAAEKSEIQLSDKQRDAQIADALELATKTLAAAQTDSLESQPQPSPAPSSETVFEETIQAVIDQAKQTVAQTEEAPAAQEREEIHTPGVKMVAAKSSDRTAVSEFENKN